MPELLTPLILQRADPHLSRHHGQYLFTASVPQYDRIELRRAASLAELPDARPVTLWRKPDCGPCSELIWAPELNRVQGQWVIYFAAAPSREIRNGLFQHRMYAIASSAADPMRGDWQLLGAVDSGLDSFCLDATHFRHQGRDHYLWAQKDPDIPGNSNLYLAPLASATRLAGPPVRLSVPEFDWECRGFSVNEGPSVLKGHGRIFISYSASATDENYAMGLLWAREDADLLDPTSWHKSPTPVMASSPAHRIYGPGHNSFCEGEDGRTLLVYHARTYTEIVGDPLWNPDRHSFVKALGWTEAGWPVFGNPALLDN